MDLCRVTETCKRFRSLTQSVIGKELSFTASSSTFCFYSRKLKYKSGTRSDAKRIFKHFGRRINEVIIANGNPQLQCDALNFVINHCDEALTHLELYHLRIPATLTQEIKPVFSGLNSLSELLVVEVQNCNIILENVFPYLKRLIYCFCEEISESHQENLILESLQAFITSHPYLEFSYIELKCDPKWWMNILQAVASSCADLQELYVHNTSVYIPDLSLALKPLQKLKSLKKLDLWNISIEDLKVFTPMTGLRVLVLDRCYLPTDSPTNTNRFLSQLTKLFMKKCRQIGAHDYTVHFW